VSSETIVKGMRKVVLILLTVITLFGAFHIESGRAQVNTERRIRSKVSPDYPEIARKMGLSGTVRLQLIIAPNGTVKDTKVIGGHPILVSAAMDAVKKWRFEPAPTETTETREFKFEPEN
jgi:TonB family protein